MVKMALVRVSVRGGYLAEEIIIRSQDNICLE
jgi:hypothetical protein